jgi:hypothetical protein
VIVNNAKASERLTAEKLLQDELLALKARIAQLEASAKLHDQQKAAELESYAIVFRRRKNQGWAIPGEVLSQAKSRKLAESTSAFSVF